MLRNYLTIAFRTARKQALFAAINVVGLAIGIACCLIILLFVYDELSYDGYHEHAGSVYRVAREWTNEDGVTTLRLARISAPIAPAIEEEFPEVQHSVRIWGNGGLVSRADRYINEERLYFAEEDFFNVFTAPLLRGDPKTALSEPFTVILTEDAARKHFGEEDPMGQVLRLDDEWDLRVTGVAENLRRNTHLPFDVLVSFATLEAVFPESAFTNWRGNNGFATYVRLREGADASAFEARLPLLNRHFDEEEGERSRLFLQPLTKIHLHSNLDTEFEPNGDIAYVYLFSAVAFFVLMIACFNFMSLATARAARRVKEIGVRKVLGAGRKQLAAQFLGETLLLASFSLGLAGVLTEVLMPFFNQLSGKSLDLFGAYPALGVAGLTGFSLVAGLLAGTYPAIYLSGFRPAGVLKGRIQGRNGLPRFRRAIVVTQFAISMVLIIGATVVYRQVQYVQTKELGFDREDLVVLPGSDEIISRFASVRAQLTAHPNVRSVTASRLVPSDQLLDHIDGTVELRGDVRPFTGLPLLPVDHEFVTTYEIPLLAGRTFSVERDSDSTEAFVINESAVRRLGWAEPEEAIGKRVTLQGSSLVRTGYVIGVTRDFHFESLKEQISPLLLFVMPERHRLVTVRLAGGDSPAAMDFLKQKWAEYLPNYPFSYRLIDSDFDQLYASEERLGRVIGTFAVLAILVACLGLFGLAAFMAEQRTKEIGIRKVLGASVAGVVALLSKDFLKLVLVAFAVAAPLSWLVMGEWLKEFAYRTAVSPGVLLAAGASVTAIALLTVSYQAIKAALTDPAESLRYE